jgi:hypothetical protein
MSATALDGSKGDGQPFEMAVLMPDGRLIDGCTAFRWALLEAHGLSRADDPGGGDGWLERLGEKILGCPVDEDPERSDKLLEQIGRFMDRFGGMMDDARQVAEVADKPTPGRVLDAATANGAEVVWKRGRMAVFLGDAATVFETTTPAPTRGRRVRERKRSPGRRRGVRSNSAASRDGPEDLEPPLGSPAKAERWRLDVEDGP